MIRPAFGSDIEDLLSRVGQSPERYSECLIAVPFVDEPFVERLANLMLATSHASCGMRVYSTPEVVRSLFGRLPGAESRWSRSIVVLRGLHAKVYVARARPPGWTEAIISSANLTEPGISRNLEFGVHARADTPAGRALLDHVLSFMRRASRLGV